MSTLFFRNRRLLILTIAVVLIGGLSALLTLPRLEDPRITNRHATIVTRMPGASAGRVETLVTEKLEDELREISEVLAAARANSLLVNPGLRFCSSSTTGRPARRAPSTPAAEA